MMIIRPDRAGPTWRINTLGGHSRGTVTVSGGALVYPEEKYSDGKQEQTYRSQWRRDGDDAYPAVTAMKVDGGWKEAWRIRMERRKQQSTTTRVSRRRGADAHTLRRPSCPTRPRPSPPSS